MNLKLQLLATDSETSARLQAVVTAKDVALNGARVAVTLTAEVLHMMNIAQVLLQSELNALIVAGECWERVMEASWKDSVRAIAC